ncbi:MAG: hypothetical protein A2Z34_04585 [Planctomycetes bacterium RBG_16_59_8]|nr:MAG: hypothetical protein A2Z34_04585 [Planctomycetes bacterium RBG_16_59_8]
MKGAFTNAAVLKLIDETAIPLHSDKGPGKEAFSTYVKMSGSFGIPAFFFLKPDGSEIVELRSVGTPLSETDLAGKLQSAAKALGKGLGKKEIEKMGKLLTSAKDAMEKEKYGKAIKEFGELARHKVTENSIVKAAREELEKIEEIGKGKIAEAQGKESEKAWNEAEKIYAMLSREFAGLAIAKEAKTALEVLKKNPEAAEALKGKK